METIEGPGLSVATANGNLLLLHTALTIPVLGEDVCLFPST